jgi:hypothetical protein
LRWQRLYWKRCNGPAPLLGQCSEILLARLQGYYFLASRVLKIHSKPKDRDQNAGDAYNDVLSDFPALLRTEFLDALGVGLSLAGNGDAVHVSILWLDNGRRSRGASGASSQHQSKARHDEVVFGHARSPPS